MQLIGQAVAHQTIGKARAIHIFDADQTVALRETTTLHRAIEINIYRRGRAAVGRGVIIRATVQRVIAQPAKQRVIAIIAVQVVIARDAQNSLVVQHVIALAA